MKKLNLLLCLVLFWTLTGRLNAASGDLDPTFGPVGFITTSLGTGADRAFAAARQPDGKLVLAGVRNFGNIAVVRYNANGTLYNSFGSGGSVVTSISNIQEASAVAVQNDGKIVVAGRGSIVGCAVVRYNTNGSLDATFDGDGIFTDSTIGVANALAIQPDGKIVTAGSIVGADFFTNSFSIVRLNPNGTFDTTFDGDGKASVKVSETNGGSSFAYALALQADGKIVVGGEGDFSTSRDFALARFNSDGSLDTTFDGDGKVRTTFGGSGQTEALRSLAVQADGKIVAAGFGGENSVRGFALARYNADGSLDATFDGDGKVVTQTSINGNEAANAVAIQPDGKIVAAGYSILQVALVSYNADGSLDTSFDGDGKAFTTINPNGSATARAVLLEPNGKIVIAGNASKNGIDEDFLLARYNADGTPSTDFGVFGYVVTNPFNQTSQSSQATGAAIQADGKIVVVGNRVAGKSLTVGDVLRYTADGRLDSSFASTQFGSGIFTISLSGATTQEINAVAIQPDGKILVCGSYEDEAQEDLGLFVARINQDGTYDSTFNGNGSIRLSAINGNGGLGQDIALQSDGKIVVVGAAPNFDVLAFEFAAFRFNQNGTLDSTFGANGVAKIDLGAGDDIAFSVAVQPDNRIVLGGAANFSDDSVAAKFNCKINLRKFGGAKRGANPTGITAFARFNANGTLDTNFGAGGKIVTPIGNSANFALDVQSQTDGKIVAAAATCLDCANGAGAAIVRYNQNGSFDNSFDGDGVVNVRVPNSVGVFVAALTIQANGKIIAAGANANPSTQADALIARYNGDGSPDATFGAGGFVTSDIGGTNQQANAVAIQSDGKIVTAGFTTNETRADIAVWRYIGDAPSANRRPLFDFDGDGKADVSVFRPANGTWYVQQSTSGFSGFQFGIPTDKITPADFDGDGKTDFAVFRDGFWYLQRSSTGFSGIRFGEANDIPVPGDFDGDGKADLAVFRPSNGIWYIQQSQLGFAGIRFGQNGDKPIAADFDGDGRADIAVFRDGFWYINRSQLGFIGVQFGQSGDKTVPADYDGDGKADIAVFRPSDRTWYLLRSQLGFTGIAFGLSTDSPAAADFDGDGKADIAVFRDGNWYIQQSTGGFRTVFFGATDDKPIPNAFVQ